MLSAECFPCCACNVRDAAASRARVRVLLAVGDHRVAQHAKVPVEWEHHVISTHAVTPGGDLISQEALDSVKRNKVGLKGPFETPVGKGHRSLNLTLRKALNLYANVRPCKSIPGLKTKYDDVDVVTIRENTEGEYSGLEHEVRDCYATQRDAGAFFSIGVRCIC